MQDWRTLAVYAVAVAFACGCVAAGVDLGRGGQVNYTGDMRSEIAIAAYNGQVNEQVGFKVLSKMLAERR